LPALTNGGKNIDGQSCCSELTATAMTSKPGGNKLAVENSKLTGQKSKMDVKKQMEEKLERGSASIQQIKQTCQFSYAKVMWNVAHQCLKVI
jgi:hypothetical protein